MTNETYEALQNYLTNLGSVEYASGIRAHLKAGRKRSTYKHNPSQYHRDLIELLGRDDEEGFKALIGEQGYASAIGH